MKPDMTNPEYRIEDEPLQYRSPVVRTLGTMPSWKRKLLGVSLIIGLIGIGGEAASALLGHSNPPPAAPAPAAQTSHSILPQGSSGFVTGQPSPADTSPAAPAPQNQNPGLTEKVTPWMTKFGLSFFVGIVAGVIFRTFIKLAVGITVLIAGLFLALSYFHILNIDMTTVKTEYASAAAWLTDQASRLKDVIFHALPSSTTAAAGFLAGFKKR